MTDDVGIIWHQRDLSVHDNPALKRASSQHEILLPVWIFDDEKKLLSKWRNLKRLKFRLDSLKDLKNQYQELDGSMYTFEGPTAKKLKELRDEFDGSVYYNLKAGLKYETTLNKKLRDKDNFHAVKTHTAVEYENPTRKNWGRNANEWFNNEIVNPPDCVQTLEIEDDDVLIKMQEQVNQTGKNSMFPTGGRKRGLERLERFKENIDSYAGCISSPSKAQDHTSHLSPYLAFGCLSVREVYQEIDGEDKSSEMFRERLVWHEHFHQKLWDNPRSVEKSVNPVFRYLNFNNKNDELIERWKKGETGYPIVDASMRALNEKGWLNFRMRAMCASFFHYILKQYWKIGADFFYRKLMDSDPAINYQQWQMQCGLVGVHANRIYDPMKQKRENDPEGEFIKDYVPELGPVPADHLDEPWKMSKEDQERFNVIIGEDYPKPVVNFEKEAAKARELYKQLADRAREAVSHPEILRQASLSDRHDKSQLKKATSWDKMDEKDRNTQNSLDEFINQ